MSDLNILEIKDKFIKVIQYSQKIEEPKVDELFSIWLENKKDIIKAFGDQLIYEMPDKVTFELSEEGKEDRVQNFINMCWNMGLEDLGSFLDWERKGFFENICDRDYNEVKKGTKLVKAFKHFVKDPKILTDMQNRASQIIQENKIDGKICFSVHPLDYLSISENTHNWRSCHALDGEYRAGNLSYMMDKSTIVCYLKSDEEAKLPNFPEEVKWNNKKWRVLLYLSDDWKMIFAGKQYPFSTQSGMNLILNKCFNYEAEIKYRKPITYGRNQYKNCFWSNWTDYKLRDIKENDIVFNYQDLHYIPLNDCLISLYDLVLNGEGSKQFNDVLSSSCYIPMYCYLLEEGWWSDKNYCLANSENSKFHIGERTYCLYCGKEEVMDSGSGTMMCYDCEKEHGVSENDSFGFCACCGLRIEVENSFYMEDQLYCAECFDNLGAKCANCGDYYLKDNMHYKEEIDEYYCSWCHNNR